MTEVKLCNILSPSKMRACDIKCNTKYIFPPTELLSLLNPAFNISPPLLSFWQTDGSEIWNQLQFLGETFI